MSQNICISTTLYKRLENHALGFGDSPTNVIERLLDHYEATKKTRSIAPSGRKDTTKYIFKDGLYGKSRLVLAVVRDYVASNPEVTFERLKEEVFPDSLQGSIGVVNHMGHIDHRYKNKSDKRHFVTENELMKTANETVAVCTQWGIRNISKFIEKAESLGYEIEEAEHS